MSWRDEKADYLQKSRDFSFLHDGDRGSRDEQRSYKVSNDRVPDNQEARDRLLRLKALEKQRADKQKKQYVGSPSPEREDRYERRETERNPGPSGSKRPPAKDNFGSFFGKVEKVVAKRVVDEKRAREIAAREARAAEAEKVAKARAESRNGSMRPPSSGSGSRAAAKPKPVNPVTVKAQKLKDNRDYSFLFSDELPSKPEGRDSRAEPSKALKDVRGSSEGLAKQKSVGTQSQKAKAASNGGVRPSPGQGSQARKPGASTSRSGSGGERDGGGRDSRYESERRAEKDSRHGSGGGRAERDSRESRHDSERRPERIVPSSRASKDERPSPRGVPSKLPLASDRAKRDGQERAKSVGPKATNHDRAVSRDSLSMKQSSTTRVTTQSSGQRVSQSGNGGVRERMVQKSTTERRVSQLVQKGSGIDASSAMKRKMVGEPAKKASINAKSNDGRRVERSRYEDSDSDPESEMRKLVAGGPRPGASGRTAPVNGLKRKPSDELRKKPLDAPTRRPMAEEPMRRKSVNELLPRKSSDELRRRASDEPMRRPAPAKVKKRPRDLDSEYESDSDDGGPVRQSGVSSIIQKMFRYNPNKYKDLDDEDDKNMETSFRHIQAEEKRSARLAREEDEREQELIEEEERQERLRKQKRQKSR